MSYGSRDDAALAHQADEFTAAIDERPTDELILAWLSQRVTSDKIREANDWLLRQKFALDRQDAKKKRPRRGRAQSTVGNHRRSCRRYADAVGSLAGAGIARLSERRKLHMDVFEEKPQETELGRALFEELVWIVV